MTCLLYCQRWDKKDVKSNMKKVQLTASSTFTWMCLIGPVACQAWLRSGWADLCKGHGWALCKMALFTGFLVERLAVTYFHIPNWRGLKVPSESMFSSLSQPVTSLSVSIKLLTCIMQMSFCWVRHPSLFLSTTAETSSRLLALTVWF